MAEQDHHPAASAASSHTAYGWLLGKNTEGRSLIVPTQDDLNVPEGGFLNYRSQNSLRAPDCYLLVMSDEPSF